MFLVVFAACSYGIDFPLYWHPDEIWKYEQLKTGNYNFFHPQLLLRLTAVADQLFAITDAKAVVVSGRLVSAVSVSLAALMFTLFVARQSGLVFGLLGGLLVAWSPTVFVSGHYFKEDAVLLAGVAASMLAMQRYLAERTLSNSAILGLALGAVCSAKYVGAITVIPVALICLREPIPLRHVLCGFGVALLVFAAVNYPMFFSGGSLVKGLRYELNHVFTEHNGIAWGVTSPRTLVDFFRNVSWLALVLFVAMAGAKLKDLSTLDIVVLGSPFLWLVVAQISAVSTPRYSMPAIALVAVGSAWFSGATMMPGYPRLIASGLLVAAFIFSATQTWSVMRALVDNPRSRTVAWIAKNLDPASVIATEFYAGLPTERRLRDEPTTERIPQKVIQWPVNLARDNTLEKLRRSGVTHVVVSAASYARYFDPYAKFSPERGVPDKMFYQALFNKFRPIHVEPGQLAADPILSAEISVYDIR